MKVKLGVFLLCSVTTAFGMICPSSEETIRMPEKEALECMLIKHDLAYFAKAIATTLGGKQVERSEIVIIILAALCDYEALYPESSYFKRGQLRTKLFNLLIPDAKANSIRAGLFSSVK